MSEVLGVDAVFDSQPLDAPYTPVNAPVSVCENVRFFQGECANDEQLSSMLAQRGDAFVFEGFSVAHRAHASVLGIQDFLPSYMGLDCQREWRSVQDVFQGLYQGLLVLGGAKMETKLPCLCSLLPRVSKVLLGGLMGKAYERLLQSDSEETLILQQYREKVMLPKDLVTRHGVQDWDACDASDILDIGPFTQRLYSNYIMKTTSFFMNGPLGCCDTKVGLEGTMAIGRALTAVSRNRNFNVGLVGGGETLSVLQNELLRGCVTLSNAGGALLQGFAEQSLVALGSFDD